MTQFTHAFSVTFTTTVIERQQLTKKERAVGLPKPTLATVFEVATSGKVYHVAALQRWIVERRQTWNGPKGFLFGQRPGLE